MMSLNTLEYYEMIKRHNLNIVYSGPLWSDGIEGIASILKKRLKFDGLPMSSAQSVFSVFVEQTTNMLMYSVEKETFSTPDGDYADVPRGVFILGTRNKSYYVQCGNVIKKESAALLKERIDYLNTLDKVQLRKYYKEKIKSSNANPESKGAGLGLIEIARRASSEIEYEFTPLDDKTVFYSMYVTVGTEV